MLNLLVSILAFAHGASATSYIDVFKQIQESGQAVWPTPKSLGGDFISSTFGPRLEVKRGYDFHRGVDIKGTPGDPIVAAYPGKVDWISRGSKNGLAVFLKHKLLKPVKLHEDKAEASYFYSLYFHCDEATVQRHDEVEAGDQIATMGDFGATPHLHMEVRFGTRCSLQYALSNPTSKCNTFLYDPAVHPLLLLPLIDVGNSNVSVMYSPGSIDQNKVVLVTTPDENPNANVYKVSIIDNASNKVRDTYELDLSLRVGINATSTSAIDTPDTNYPFIAPISFNQNGDQWKTNLVIPWAWYGSKRADEAVIVEVLDIWSESSIFVFGLGEEW